MASDGEPKSRDDVLRDVLEHSNQVVDPHLIAKLFLARDQRHRIMRGIGPETVQVEVEEDKSLGIQIVKNMFGDSSPETVARLFHVQGNPQQTANLIEVLKASRNKE
ncbi:hypothetical protein KKA95_00485 [Patescibacteria group bacterium]|nr:hypothetical protein [Patescibacteria group bacterium]